MTASTLSPKHSGVVIIAGKQFNVDAPVINWTQPPYWDATREFCIPTATDPGRVCAAPFSLPPGMPQYTKRYALRPALRRYGMNPPLDATQAVIKQFVIHHDGCTSSDMCFAVLQNERGLSVHFMVDNDGTIYQTIDLAFMAYHAAEWNTASIGVELCNKGDAKLYPTTYDAGRFGPKRDVKACRINGTTLLGFDYTKAQYDAMYRLSRALTRLLPNLPVEYPQSSPGVQNWDTMPTSASFSFAGYIGHYHLTNQKWDPGPFDFKDFCSKVRGAFCFPIFPKEDPKRLPDDRPTVPQGSDDLKEMTTDLYKSNELKADGGFFPVGPWGDARLWHGGVHVTGKDGGPVYAPFPGRMIAARMGKTSSVGSVNFALLRHDMSLGKARVQFYSLYMHLADELGTLPAGAKQPEWMTKEDSGWKKQNAKAGDVVLLDEPIEAGALLGHIGRAGPADMAKPQMHLEFFATNPLFTDLDNSPWQLVDGTSGARFCDVDTIVSVIDTDHDGTLSHSELENFFGGGNSNGMRYLVTLHVSEWTGDPSWKDALKATKDFKKLKPAEVDQLVDEQITPGLWWDDKVAAHCKLPPDATVYHYHPVTFLGWFNQLLLDAAATAANTKAVDAGAAQSTKDKGITDDLGDVNGTSQRSSADVAADPCNQKIGLKEMVEGYDAPDCGP